MKELTITPEGWTTTLYFREGFYQCGEAVDGIGMTREIDDGCGGVMTNKDAKKLADAIYEHLKGVSKRKDEALAKKLKRIRKSKPVGMTQKEFLDSLKD